MRATILIPMLAVVVVGAAAARLVTAGPVQHYSERSGSVHPVPLAVGGLSKPNLGGLGRPQPGIFTKPHLGAPVTPHLGVFPGHRFGGGFKPHPGVFVRPRSWVLPPPPGVKLRAPHIRPGWQHVPHVLRVPSRRHHVLPGRKHFAPWRPPVVIVVPRSRHFFRFR